MEVVSYQSQPTLRRPVMVVAFSGWNDAADAATTALGVLQKRWAAGRFAAIDPEDFYDFMVTRPQVRMEDDGTRHIDWPEPTFSAALIPDGDRDAVLLEGAEPSFRWRTFCSAVIDVARRADVELVVTLGALLANRPHSRPVRVSGTSADPQLSARLGLGPSRYEGPTGIIGVLGDRCHAAGIPVVSLWAWVPHYLRDNPSPKAALELLRRLRILLDLPLELDELAEEAEAYDRQVNEAVADDPDFAAQVEALERLADEEELQDPPTGEQIAAELERFLKDQRPDG